MSNLVDWAEQGADAFRAFCIVNGYRENVNEGLWDWLEANGFTGTSLCCKIRQAKEADFDFSTFSAGGWTPLALFASSEQGVWYDPSDLSTMFQDPAGTTPVTAVGQPVGKILDKSGRGNHATQATAASRPLLQQDGSGKYYLDFDGVDDYLKTDIVDLSAYYATSSFVGANMTGASNTWNIFGLNQDYASINGAYHMQPTRIVIRDNTFSRTPNYPSAIVIGTPSVLSFVCDFQGTADAVSSRNTVDGTPVSLTSGIAFPNNRAFYIAYSSNPLYFPGRIYSIVSVMKKVSSTDKAEAEAYVNSKTGAY